MKNSNVTTAIILDTRYQKDNSNTYPVRLRLTHLRVQKYFPTQYDLTKTAWQKMHSSRPDKLKDTLLELNEIENRAKKIIEKIPVFSFDTFKKKFLNIHDNSTIKGAFSKYIADLNDNDRVGTAYSYNNAINSIEEFKPGATFFDINVEFLNKYEKSMIAKGKSQTTVGIYLRSLRTLLNKAISDGDIPADSYPFGRNKYQIPSTKNEKKALTLSDIKLIYDYKAKGATARARDYWLFMYLSNGLNCKDMLELKYENIKGDFLVFRRAKTSRTKKVIENIRVALQEDTKRIIKIHGRKNAKPDDYIFPELDKTMSPTEAKKKKDLAIRLINDHMKIIAEAVKIDKPVTSGFARHSFATVLKRSGAGIEFISEALGHSDTKTTKHYLDSFEDDSIREKTKALTAFKDIKAKPAKVVNI